MPRLVSSPPAYRRHKASGQALVTLAGQDVYLGAHGTAASRREYDRVVGEWLARGRQLAGADDTRRVADVILRYWTHAQTYHAGPQGTSELRSTKAALGMLRRLYGDTLAREFGPLALQALRESMIRQDWSRNFVNAQVARLKRCFKWAVSQELVPSSVYEGLRTVAGLKEGKTEARETDPVRPVAIESVEAVIPHVSRQVGAIVRLLLASGMRPGEAVILRRCDLDMSGDVWGYAPQRHKTQHRGHARVIYLGPQAQAIIRDFFKPDLAAYLFSPADAERERREAQHEARKTPLNCGNRPGSNRARKPKRPPADRYTTDSFGKAITKGLAKAFPPPPELARQQTKGSKSKALRWETDAEWRARLGKRWAELVVWQAKHHWHPHRLRHTAATRIRKQYGLEAARVVLGQKSAKVAEIYAEIDQTKAEAIMGEVG